MQSPGPTEATLFPRRNVLYLSIMKSLAILIENDILETDPYHGQFLSSANTAVYSLLMKFIDIKAQRQNKKMLF